MKTKILMILLFLSMFIGSANAQNLQDNFYGMFAHTNSGTAIRILAATETAGTVSGNLNDRWMGSFTTCGGLTCLRVAGGASGITDAADLTYTPASNANWNGSADPGNGNAAFDQLAARVKTIESTPTTPSFARTFLMR